MTVIYKKMTQTQMIVVGYLLLILLGSILLMLLQIHYLPRHPHPV